MPIHLPAMNRRHFLSVIGAGALSCSVPVRADESAAETVYLLNDTHIGEKHPPDSPVPTHLRQVVEELVGLRHKPACVVINGDLALKDGQPGDYRHLGQLLEPLHRAGLDLHLTLGNHDHRDVFYEQLSEQRPENPPVDSRHISVVQTRNANFFLLDSLKKTMVTQGEIGASQLKWLARALDQHPSRPAIIVTHHNPRLGGDPNHFPGGLIDSRELWEVLGPRKHVKAYVHGHIHDRTLAQHAGIHIINTPATSYVADRTKSTTGWTVARFTSDGVTLRTRTTDPNHQWNGEEVSLKWRDD